MPHLHLEGEAWTDPHIDEQPEGQMAGVCYGCPEWPDGHPLVGDVAAHLADIVGEEAA